MPSIHLTKLYRAVVDAEFQDLMINRQFRAGPNSLGGKFFAERADDAARWGDLLEGVGNYRVIEVEIPTEVAEQLMRWDMLDGIGPARFAEFDQLSDFTFREVKP